MKYKLKDLCSITKGATGIMKADGGKYPLVALSDERRSHSEFQFDAKAVIVPLISSTGHGHASMKRVHYQEGKFALGNILCAVIPNDKKQLNAKYLHLYLQQFKETLLVPLMKGAANVSLPMNKLADVEIEVPSLERQLEIIALEDEAAELKNELEEKLFLQDGEVTKLRQTILREAMQGKLVKQNSKDGNATDLLKKIRTEKEKLIAHKKVKREKEVDAITESEISFSIPSNWCWCRLGEISETVNDGVHYAPKYLSSGIPSLSAKDIFNNKINFEKCNYVSVEEYNSQKEKFMLKVGSVLVTKSGSIGRTTIYDGAREVYLVESVGVINTNSNFLNPHFIKYFIDSIFDTITYEGEHVKGMGVKHLTLTLIKRMQFPLPPLLEQNRIVKKIEQFMQLCDELQYSIQQSKIENEKLLQGALRDALKKEEVAV